jgi:hypothetical protein
MMNTLLTSSDKELQKMNGKHLLSAYIDSHSEILAEVKGDKEKAIEQFELLNVHFQNLENRKEYADVLQQVYEHHLYVLSKEHVELFAASRMNLDVDRSFWSTAATRILPASAEPVSIYTEKKITEFISLILQNTEEIRDDAQTVLRILNDERIDSEKKIAYLKILKTEIPHLTDIEDTTLWDDVLKGIHVSYTEENMAAYFFGKDKTWTKELTDFINKGMKKLTFHYQSLDDKYGKGSGSEFWKAVISCMELSNQKYEEILVGLNGCYRNGFGFDSFTDEKMEILIRRGIIHMTAKCLQDIRENYPSHVISFATSYIQEYVKLMTEELYEKDEVLELLESSIHVTYKLKLLRMADFPISVVGKNYTLAVKENILKEHFEEKDLSTLAGNYSKEDLKLQPVIIQLVSERIERILEENIRLDEKLFIGLMAQKLLSVNQKQQLLAANIYRLTKEQTAEYLQKLGKTEFLQVFDGNKNPKFLRTDSNYQILEAFQRKNWIGKIRDEEVQGEDYYRVRGKK